jgi:hypothetical protein
MLSAFLPNHFVKEVFKSSYKPHTFKIICYKEVQSKHAMTKHQRISFKFSFTLLHFLKDKRTKNSPRLHHSRNVTSGSLMCLLSTFCKMVVPCRYGNMKEKKKVQTNKKEVE